MYRCYADRSLVYVVCMSAPWVVSPLADSGERNGDVITTGRDTTKFVLR